MRLFLSFLLAASMLLLTALTACKATDSQLPAALADPSAASSTAGQATPADGVRRIGIEEARAEFESGKAVIIDVRGDAAYKNGHIKGAQSIAFGDVPAKAGELPKDKTIILYCSCPAEHSSVAAGQALHQRGVDNTAALVGGYPAWKSAGYPVEENSSN